MKKKILAIFVILTFLLSACGKNEEVEPSYASGSNEEMAEEIRWKLVETEIPTVNTNLEMEELFEEMIGDTIYRIAKSGIDGTDENIYVQIIESPYVEWENLAFSENELPDMENNYLRDILICSDGVQLLWENNKNYYWVKCTKEKEECIQVASDEQFDASFWASVSLGYVAEDGSSYFVTQEKVYCFDQNLNEKKEWLNMGYVWQILEDAVEEKVYLCGSTQDGEFTIWTMDSREPVFSSDKVSMSFDGKVVLANTKEGFLCVPEGIWQFDMESGEIENVLMFQEQGYSIERVNGAYIDENGDLCVLVVADGKNLLLKRKKDDGWRSKVELELATGWANPFLEKMVVDFNKNNSEYYIALRECEEGENWEDYITRIQMEISSGGGPALLTDEVLDLNNAAKKGMLKDLTEDFTEEKSRMFVNIQSYGKIGESSFAIPYCCYVDTLVVSEEVVGDKKSWTPEEFMEYVKESGAEKAVCRIEGAELYWYLISRGGLIDWEKGISYLNSNEAVSLLEFAGEYGGEDTYENAYKLVAEGNTLTMRGYVATVSSMAHLEEALFQEKEVYIGYPIDNDLWETGNLLGANAIAINQACGAPEGAIAFIKYLLKEENQDWLAENACESSANGFPVTENALNNMFLYAEKQSNLDADDVGLPLNTMGFSYLQEPLSKQGLGKIRKLLQDAKPQTIDMPSAESIIFEEVSAYFSDNRSAQDVCENIHNRVQLYLNENQ